MDSYYVGIIIAIAAIVLSFLILAIFMYRIYLIVSGNEDQLADKVENDTMKSTKMKDSSNLNKLLT